MAYGRISRQKWQAFGSPPLPIGTELYDEPTLIPPVISPLETKMAQLPISSPIPPLPTLPSTGVIYPPAGQITPAPVSTLPTLPATGLISPPSAILTPQSISPITTPKAATTTTPQSISPITTPKAATTTTPQSVPLTGALTLEEILALRKIIGTQGGALVRR